MFSEVRSRLTQRRSHNADTAAEAAARQAAMQRHECEVRELKRFWNLLLRGMEVKVWRETPSGSVLKDQEADSDGVSDDLLALGDSVLGMMDVSPSQSDKQSSRVGWTDSDDEQKSSQTAQEADDVEERYDILWMSSSEPVLCIDKEKSHSAAHRSPECLLLPLTQLEDPTAVDVDDDRFYAFVLQTKNYDSSTSSRSNRQGSGADWLSWTKPARVVVGVPTERCRSLMLLHLGRVMSACSALDQKDADSRNLSFSANMEVALFATNPLATFNNAFLEGDEDDNDNQQPEQEPDFSGQSSSSSSSSSSCSSSSSSDDSPGSSTRSASPVSSPASSPNLVRSPKSASSTTATTLFEEQLQLHSVQSVGVRPLTKGGKVLAARSMYPHVREEAKREVERVMKEYLHVRQV